MYKLIIIITIILSGAELTAQQIKPAYSKQWFDVAGTAGNSSGVVVLSYVHNWRIGKSKWQFGTGARLVNFFGSNLNYTTAPARLARGNTTPVALLFSSVKNENLDTLTVRHPYSSSLNASLNLAYNFNSKWSAGLNIDLIGFTIGKKSEALLINNGIERREPVAKPQAFNVLLTDDLDYGTLNSEVYLKYSINKRWGIRGIYQFLVNEYKTTSIKQTAPDGTAVDRFRYKANNYGIGIAYNL
jgi:hypothetical protein